MHSTLKVKNFKMTNYISNSPISQSSGVKIAALSVAIIIPSDNSPINLAGFKLVTTGTFLPTKSSGAYLFPRPAIT